MCDSDSTFSEKINLYTVVSIDTVYDLSTENAS